MTAKSAADLRKERLERFTKAQAALPEAQRLENRTDLALPSVRAYAYSTNYQHEAACRWFQEFMEACQPELYDQKYFETQGEVMYRPETFKAYTVYLSQTRSGRINDKPSVNTILSMISILFTQIQKKRRCVLLPADKDDVKNFIRNALKNQEGLTTAMLVKPVAFAEDTSYLFSVLYSTAYLATFSEMRIVLNLSLYINLMIDAAGRGGDMLFSPACKEVPFAWKHVEIYAFPSGIDGVHFEGLLTFRFMKGMKLDDSKFKRVAINLLSTQSAVEDSMRLLLVLALMDGILDGIDSWEDLMRLRPPPTGALIHIKPSMAELPVFRKVCDNGVVSDLPEPQHRVQREIVRLRFACGFEHRLTGFAWRRGVAYILDVNTTAANRRYLMGHKSNSEIYSHYLPRVTDVDLQALFRGTEPQDLRKMMSIGLNRKDNAPTRISNAGYADVLADPALAALTIAFSAMEATLRSEHGSAVAASRMHDPRFEEYKSLLDQRRRLRDSLIRKRFKEEYMAFFAQAACPQAPAGEHSIQQQSPLPTRLTTTLSKGSSPATSNDNIPLDPLLFGDESAPSISEDSLFVSALDPLELAVAEILERSDEIALTPVESDMQAILDGEADDGEDVMDLVDPAATQQLLAPTSRLHGLPNKSLMLARNQRGSSRYYVGSNACEGLYEVLTGGSTEATLMQKAIECFSIHHVIDAFYPGQEPPRGTYACPVCSIGLLLHEKYNPEVGNAAWRHTFSCTRKVLLEAASVELKARCPFDRPCQFQKLVVTGSTTAFQQCGNVAKSWPSFFNHNKTHIHTGRRTNGSSPTAHFYCFFKGCAHDLSPRGTDSALDATPRTDPRFDSPAEFNSHIAAAHDIFHNSKEEPIVDFCYYCETWLGPFDDFGAHTMSHEIDAVQLVKDSGYEAPIAGRPLRPDLCIFCYHNHNLPLYERILPRERTTQRYHTPSHFSKIPDDAAINCPAYPEMCTCDVKFSKDDLREHLSNTHGLTTTGTARAKKKKRPSSTILADKDANTAIKPPSKSAKKKKKTTAK